MMRLAAFEKFCLSQNLAINTISQYRSYLGRINTLLGGLDEAIERDGVEKLLAWAQTETREPFHQYPSTARTTLKRYVDFHLGGDFVEDQVQEDLVQQAQEAQGLAFRLEKEMHGAVRKQLANIEVGLKEADDGQEMAVSTGNIDIVARDGSGKLVVIELKAGKCPAGAMEQALGYAEALAEDKKEPVRVLLIASEFSDRMRAAAKRTVDLKLLTYEFSLKFNEIK